MALTTYFITIIMHWKSIHLSQWKGMTPLIAASLGGQQECAKLLIEAGANINVPNEVRVICCVHVQSVHPSLDCSRPTVN